jgi:hypothetical protein
MILVSTDGLNKSYSHDAGFLKVGSDLLNMVREEGIQSVSSQLPALLNEVSLNGSGDDVSLGIIKRCDTDDKEPNEEIAPAGEHDGVETLKTEIDPSDTEPEFAVGRESVSAEPDSLSRPSDDQERMA